MTIAIVLGSLALLAATVCLLLLWRAEKRSTKQRAALMEYTEVSVRLSADQLYRRCAELEGHLAEAQEKIAQLESGTVPDFEKAKEAANAVNDFNAGITGILGFDPIMALKKQRESAGDTR